MPKSLIIDGIKFNLWVPEDEERDFHPIVKEHCTEIFGEDTRCIDIPPRLKSDANIGSEPDFIVVDPTNSKLYIVEVELSKHPTSNHILDQLTRFMSGLGNVATANMFVEALLDIIEANKSLKRFFEDKVTENIFRWLLRLIKKPSIVVVIEEKTPPVIEACNLLKKDHPDTSLLEFQTYRREDAPSVHAHLFDTLTSTAEVSEEVGKKDESKKQLVLKKILATKKHFHATLSKV